MSRSKPSTTTEALYNSQVLVASVPNRFLKKAIPTPRTAQRPDSDVYDLIIFKLSFTPSRFGPGVLVLLKKKKFTLDHVPQSPLRPLFPNFPLIRLLFPTFPSKFPIFTVTVTQFDYLD